MAKKEWKKREKKKRDARRRDINPRMRFGGVSKSTISKFKEIEIMANEKDEKLE